MKRYNKGCGKRSVEVPHVLLQIHKHLISRWGYPTSTTCFVVVVTAIPVVIFAGPVVEHNGYLTISCFGHPIQSPSLTLYNPPH